MNKIDDTQTLASIAKSSITYIQSSIDNLSNLMDNLNLYRQCMVDCFNLLAESADKSTENNFTDFSQSHTLPAVVSVPQSRISDSEKLEQIKTAQQKALKQKRIFFRFLDNDSKLLYKSFEGLKRLDSYFEEFIEIFNSNIDLSLQTNRTEQRSPKTKPSIKLSLDQKLIK